MSIASTSLDLIRRVFRRDQMTLPGGPDIYDGMNFTSQSLGGTNIGLGGQQGDNGNYLSDAVATEQDIVSRYQDSEEMDQYPEISASFDLLADDATVQDVLDGRSLWFEAPDHVIQEILEDMVTKQLRVEEDLWEIVRGICKWGNEYKEIVAIDRVGVVELRSMHAPQVRRIQDPFGMLYGFVQDPSMGFGISTDTFLTRLQSRGAMSSYMDQVVAQSYDDLIQVYEPWEVVHFRNRSANSSDPYGLSTADAARYAWRRLIMMEDSMVLYKITRSPQRYAFYVDIGDQPPNLAKSLLEKVKNDFRKKQYTDRAGKLQTRYSPLGSDEDFFLPVRKGNRATEVDVLSGPEGQQIDDVNYFKDKMISALKVPKSYLGSDDTVGRANLSQMDVRMARSVMRLQRVAKNGMNQVARVDLSAKNIDPDRVEFECKMNVPSGVLELAQIEVQNAKLDLAMRYQQLNFPEYFIWSNILGMSDDDIAMNQEIRDSSQFMQTEAHQELASKIASTRIAERKTQNMIEDAKASQMLKAQGSRILDEVAAGRTDFARKMRELKMLIGEVRQAQSPTRRRRRQP